MATEVYSWRVSSELKSDLEREARLRKVSLSSVLDSAARDWLKKAASNNGDDQEQQRLHTTAESCLGIIKGRSPYRAENAQSIIRKRIQERNER